MYIVYADRKADPAHAERRAFEAEAFSHALAPDRASGTVSLQPGGTVLRVGGATGEYQRVRIFDQRGSLAGAMILADGIVGWTVPRAF